MFRGTTDDFLTGSSQSQKQQQKRWQNDSSTSLLEYKNISEEIAPLRKKKRKSVRFDKQVEKYIDILYGLEKGKYNKR